MRLISFKLHDNYIFDLNFEDGAKKKVDLSNLIKSKVTLDELKSANIDKDWAAWSSKMVWWILIQKLYIIFL